MSELLLAAVPQNLRMYGSLEERACSGHALCNDTKVLRTGTQTFGRAAGKVRDTQS